MWGTRCDDDYEDNDDDRDEEDAISAKDHLNIVDRAQGHLPKSISSRKANIVDSNQHFSGWYLLLQRQTQVTSEQIQIGEGLIEAGDGQRWVVVAAGAGFVQS